MTNKCTIISQIITLLHVSTLSCYPQGACNQYVANPMVITVRQLYQSFYYPTNAQCKIRRFNQNTLKLQRLLQHVSVYKETIIREPQPVLS